MVSLRTLMSSIEHGSAAEGLPGTGVVDVVINDAQVVRVPIHEVDEPLVGVPVTCRNHPRVRNDGPSKFQVRADVARRLVLADAALGSASLVVVEGHRSTAVQERFWNHWYAEVAFAHPGWNTEQIGAETARFVAPPDGHPPHSTGGAVDVILVDASGAEIDMGSALNDPGSKMGMAAVVGQEARRWRDCLSEAMSVAGFVNYPHEWWHFSYGDQYWAWRTYAPAALYGRVG